MDSQKGIHCEFETSNSRLTSLGAIREGGSWHRPIVWWRSGHHDMEWGPVIAELSKIGKWLMLMTMGMK
jgi:hypothetical protein